MWWIDSIIIYPVMEFLELPQESELTQNAGYEKARGEMDIFELQMMGMHLDDQDEARRRRGSPNPILIAKRRKQRGLTSSEHKEDRGSNTRKS